MREYITGTWGFQGFWPWERATVLEFKFRVSVTAPARIAAMSIRSAIASASSINDRTPEEREARRLW